MNILQRLTRFEETANDIRSGLSGDPFVWPQWERRLKVAHAAKMGCTLVTVTALEKSGHQLKSDARAVGRAYFGAPASKYADLYVLELQAVAVKPNVRNCRQYAIRHARSWPRTCPTCTLESKCRFGLRALETL